MVIYANQMLRASYLSMNKVAYNILKDRISFESEKSIAKSDQNFLNDYWSRYQKLFFESRDDKSILELKDSLMNRSLIEVSAL